MAFDKNRSARMPSTSLALTEIGPWPIRVGAGGARAPIAEMTKCRAVAGEFTTDVLPRRPAARGRLCRLPERDVTATTPTRLIVLALAGPLMSR